MISTYVIFILNYGLKLKVGNINQKVHQLLPSTCIVVSKSVLEVKGCG